MLDSHQYIKKNIFFETIRPNELEFHMKTPYSKRTSINAHGLCHMDKMAAMPFYDKKNLKKNLLQNQRVMYYWGLGD